VVAVVVVVVVVVEIFPRHVKVFEDKNYKLELLSAHNDS